MSEERRREQFQRIVDVHQAALVRLSRGYEANEAQQAELVQDILLRIWRALPSFRGDSSLRTWAFRIAHNAAATHVLKAKRQRSTSDAWNDSPDAPDEEVSRELRLRQLQTAVQRLPLVDRQLILLYLEEVPQQQIAEITGLSLSNVSTRLHRARHTLKQMMRPNHG